MEISPRFERDHNGEEGTGNRVAKIGQDIGQSLWFINQEKRISGQFSHERIGQISIIEAVDRIEPARIEPVPARLSDLIAELAAATATLGQKLHPKTSASLADQVRVMNTYYSNLIEGHNTRPRDIERALANQFAPEEARRNLQIEARAHVRVQRMIDAKAADGSLPEPAGAEFLKRLHRDFYFEAAEQMLIVGEGGRKFVMTPGSWRSESAHDVDVGRHQPPSSDRVADFMRHFEWRYRFEPLGKAERMLAMATAHHRFNYIHPFPDGNGRVSRLMSHAMAHRAGIGAHGLWSVSRGLARGLESRDDYKRMMDHADTPRQGDRDGRGNLSEQALIEFTDWFLRVCLDQVCFMADLFDLATLGARLKRLVDRSETLKPEAFRLLEEALLRGEFERGAAERLTGLPERTARRLVRDLIDQGLLASDTEKGPVSLRFPSSAHETLFPRLYPEA